MSGRPLSATASAATDDEGARDCRGKVLPVKSGLTEKAATEPAPRISTRKNARENLLPIMVKRAAVRLVEIMIIMICNCLFLHALNFEELLKIFKTSLANHRQTFHKVLDYLLPPCTPSISAYLLSRVCSR
jgi:hypothetical protein